MPEICDDDFAQWKELYDDWAECEEEESELEETGLQLDAAMDVACLAAIFTTETLVGGLVLGSACGIAIWMLADAIDDVKDHREKCAELSAKSNAQGDKYNMCYAQHKNDP